MKLRELGFDSFFEGEFRKLGSDHFPARVVAEHRGIYKVKGEAAEYFAKVTGKRMFEAGSREDYPAVGDWVIINDLGNNQAVIGTILPRRSIIKRKFGKRDEIQVIAANVDTALVVESVDRDYNLNRFERYFVLAQDGGARPAIVLNKTDLIPPEELARRREELKRRFKDTDVIATSVITSDGLAELEKYIEKGKTYCFLGSSGVGKSSLINKLLGEFSISTNEVSFYSGRGRHTTTRREMYFLKNGGIVIDNPGIREVGMADSEAGLESAFDEISTLAARCKYVDCSHTNESGCAVLSAIRSGELDGAKYSNYMNLKKEAEHYKLAESEKREKDRKFGKYLKEAKEGLKRVGHKDY